MVAARGPAIKGDVYLAGAFAKDGDNVLTILVIMLENSIPDRHISGNSFLDA
jgi:hypothetical protein